jgi:hypothetical protein
MGLYLCIVKDDEELEGVEVGSYKDFGDFRDAVVASVENGDRGSVCPVLETHHDSDGEWSPDEAMALLSELDIIEKKFTDCLAIELNSPWKKDVAKLFGIVPKNLFDCFFDVDGEPLVMRLRTLARASPKRGNGFSMVNRWVARRARFPVPGAPLGH